jgi:hypothetical protein
MRFYLGENLRGDRPEKSSALTGRNRSFLETWGCASVGRLPQAVMLRAVGPLKMRRVYELCRFGMALESHR